MERGDPHAIKALTAGHSVERVQKTVCLQLMPTRLSDLRWHSPVEMQADLRRFPVSIRALPDALKVHAEIISLFIVVLFVFSSEVTRWEAKY